MSDYAKVNNLNFEDLYDKYKHNLDGAASSQVPVSGESNPFSSQGVNPTDSNVSGIFGVGGTSASPSTQRVNPYVENQDLFSSLEGIGSGEHSPSQVNEYTGKKLDIWG